MSIMNTCTGRKFDPMHIKPENICLEVYARILFGVVFSGIWRGGCGSESVLGALSTARECAGDLHAISAVQRRIIDKGVFFLYFKVPGRMAVYVSVGKLFCLGAALGNINGSDSWFVLGRHLSVGSSSVWSVRDGRWCSFVSAPGTLLFTRNYISDGGTCPQICVSSTFSGKS